MTRVKRTVAKEAKIEVETDSSKHDLCFVIMPFGGWFDVYYEKIYREAIVRAGLTPRRADDLYRPSNIVQDIWEFTKKAKVILADLTDKNPNVLYELGLAHALAKPVILISERIDDIPFDLRSLRIIGYDKNRQNWGEILTRDIEKAIKETIESPTQTIPAAFLESSRSGIQTHQLSKYEIGLLELKQELELVKRRLAGERWNASEIVERKNRLNSVLEEIKSKDSVPENVIDEVKKLHANGATFNQMLEALRTEWGLSEGQIVNVFQTVDFNSR